MLDIMHIYIYIVYKLISSFKFFVNMYSYYFFVYHFFYMFLLFFIHSFSTLFFFANCK